MPLDLIVDTLDSIPETARGAYVKQEDGKFKLDFEVEDTKGLKSALQKERERADNESKSRKAWEKLGKTPDEIGEMLDAQRKAADDAAKKAGNFDSILKQKEDEWSKKAQNADQRADRAMSVARSAVVDSSVLGALAKAKALLDQAGTSDFLTDRLGKRVQLNIDDDGARTITIMQADGKTPMAGSGADGTATFDDLVKEAVKTWPNLFEGSGHGGGGKQPGGQGGKPGDKTITRADYDKLPPAEQRQKVHVEKYKLID